MRIISEKPNLKPVTIIVLIVFLLFVIFLYNLKSGELNYYQNIYLKKQFKTNKELKIVLIDSGIIFNQKFVKIRNIGSDTSGDTINNTQLKHGFAVASIIGSQKIGDSNFGGFFPGIQLYGVNIPENNLNTNELVKALNVSRKVKPDIVNISMGSFNYDERLSSIVQELISQGTTIICSSGNSFERSYNYPASLPGVISVGALDSTYNVLDSSTYNDKVDIFTRGYQMPALQLRNGEPYVTLNTGTSFSTPVITSLVIMMKSIQPGLTPKEIEYSISKFSDKYRGYWGNELVYIKSIDFQKIINGLSNNRGDY